jgi:isoamylase
MALVETPDRVRTQILVERGEPLPLGLWKTPDGFNFAVFSRNAREVTLLFFNGLEVDPFQTIVLNPHENRTGDIWHVHLRGDLQGKSYVLQVHGPWHPEEGHRFDRRNLSWTLTPQRS